MIEIARHKILICAILGASFLLRALLIHSGGQFFTTDEERYIKSQEMAAKIRSGKIDRAISALATADHLLYNAVGTVPAWIEAKYGADSRIPALFFSLFSVLNIYIIWEISRKLGAAENEALLAAFLLACSSTFLYYTRHLLPYDFSMAFGLIAIWMAIERSPRALNSILVGFFSSLCFLAYYGYWTMAAVAMLAGVFYAERSWSGSISRGLLIMLGFAIPVSVPLFVTIISEHNIFFEMLAFSYNVYRGTYSEGWSLPFEYLWHAEHLLLILWCLAAIDGILLAFRKTEGSERFLLAMAGFLVVYGSLFVFSVVLEKFVVYGRLARQLVPFLCLAGAYVLERSRTRFPHLSVTFILLMLLQTGFNFYQPITQEFPSDFRARANRIIETQSGEFEILYAELFIPPPFPGPLPDRSFETIISARHPLQFRPYLYEGYKPEERRVFEELDISMRLIRYIK